MREHQRSESKETRRGKSGSRHHLSAPAQQQKVIQTFEGRGGEGEAEQQRHLGEKLKKETEDQSACDEDTLSLVETTTISLSFNAFLEFLESCPIL